tara:strand:+ start:479 stop:784 length:306 start_codon:yes stop_codon:yes gene_type:complete
MTGELIKASKLNDGDIFYLSIASTNNEHWIGEDHDLTGADMILIADDCSELHNNMIMVNGGFNVYVEPKQKVIRIAHYSELIDLRDSFKKSKSKIKIQDHE